MLAQGPRARPSTPGAELNNSANRTRTFFLVLVLAHMAAGCPQQAKRAFFKVLLAVAALYGGRVEVTRESSDEAVLKAFKFFFSKFLHANFAHPRY